MGNIPEVESYNVYGEETGVYATPPGTVTSHFGLIQNSRARIKNQYQGYKGIGAGLNDRQISAAGLLDTGIGFTFQVFNADFLKYVLGSVSGAGSVGDPYVYAEANTLPSLTIEDAYNLDTDQVLRFIGSVAARMTIRCSLGKPVEVDLEFNSYDVTKSNTYQSITVPSTDLFTFIHGSCELPSGSALTEIQECTITVDLKLSRHGGIGGRKGTVKVQGRSYSGNYKKLINDGVGMEDAMGGTTTTSSGTPAKQATLRLNLTDGSRYIYLTINDVYADWESDKAVGNPSNENITFEALSAGAVEVV